MTRNRILLSVSLLLLVVCQAFAERISYKSCHWDDTYKRVVTSSSEAECEVIENVERNDWLKLKNGGYYVVKGKVSYYAINVSGTVHLVLADGAELMTNHIKVDIRENSVLHIYGQSDDEEKMGKLYVDNNSSVSNFRNCAAIGGNEEVPMGSLYIHGGSVTASTFSRLYNNGKETYGAAIGGGMLSGIAYNHQVVVYAGIVYAKSGAHGAAIGGGYDGGQGGPIIIYGGRVKAESNGAGAGIGSGAGYRFRRPAGMVKIYGGTVDAIGHAFNHHNGKYGGAGIGAGAMCDGGTVEIHGGTVHATGNHASAGIGGSMIGDGGVVEIKGGTVTADYADDVVAIGPGIGAGYYGNGGKVSITGGHVIARNKYFHEESCAPIGGGAKKEAGLLAIGPGMKVSWTDNAGEHPVETADKRQTACLTSTNTSVVIDACQHGSATYIPIDNSWHRISCKTCAYSKRDIHHYNNGVCVCGKKQNVDVESWTVTIFTSTDGKNYSGGTTNKVAKGNVFQLPVPEQQAGLIFMGYLAATTAPASVEMQDSEMTQLFDGGQTVTPSADVSYYARYRYDYTAEWEWNDECTEAKVTISNALLQETTTLSATITEDVSRHIPATESALGERFFDAALTYTHSTGANYQFADQSSLLYYNQPRPKVVLDAVNPDAYNTELLVEHLNIASDITLNNFTLKKDNKIHSICLPFNVAYLSGTPLEGATLYQVYGTQLKDNEYTVAFKHVAFAKAGTPLFYRFESGTDISNPEFKNVTVCDLSGNCAVSEVTPPLIESGDGYVELWGTYEPLAATDEMCEQVFTMDGNAVSTTEGNVSAFSCYFYLPNLYNADANRLVRSVFLNFEPDDAYRFSHRLYYSWDGNGELATPFVIKTPEQLNEMQEALNGTGADKLKDKCFLQAANLVFDKSIENNYTPVKSFAGYYDGGGHTVSGLNINKPNKDIAALFAQLEDNALVKNVILQNSTLRGMNAAGIAYYVRSGSAIKNCHVLKDVTIEATDYAAGGIAGSIEGKESVLASCSSQSRVVGSTYAGGVVGAAYEGSLTDCFYLGSSVTVSDATRVSYARAVAGTKNSTAAYTNCCYTAPALTDADAQLMPIVAPSVDNTAFLTRLHQRDEYLKNSGLSEQQIAYDLTLNALEPAAQQLRDGKWKRVAYNLCLPFTMSIPSELQNAVKVYRLHTADLQSQALLFAENAPVLEAGKPYVVVVGEGKLALTAQDVLVREAPAEPVVVNTTDGTQQVGWWKATFTQVAHDDLVEQHAYLIQHDGQFRRVSTAHEVTVNPFHSYFGTQSSLDVANFQTKLVDTQSGNVTAFPADEFFSDTDFPDDATGIESVDNGEWTMDEGAWYTLDGRKVADGTLPKGIYIHNGKRVVIK